MEQLNSYCSMRRELRKQFSTLCNHHDDSPTIAAWQQRQDNDDYLFEPFRHQLKHQRQATLDSESSTVCVNAMSQKKSRQGKKESVSEQKENSQLPLIRPNSIQSIDTFQSVIILKPSKTNKERLPLKGKIDLKSPESLLGFLSRKPSHFDEITNELPKTIQTISNEHLFVRKNKHFTISQTIKLQKMRQKMAFKQRQYLYEGRSVMKRQLQSQHLPSQGSF